MDLLAYRFRWYAFETGRLLRRYWKTLFLITMLTSPAFMPVVEQARALGAPVLFGLSSAQGFGSRFASLVLYEGAGVLWLMVQRDAIRGGVFADYLQSLPLPLEHSRGISLLILSVANTPLFLPAYAALYAMASQPEPALSILYVVDVVLLTTSIQMAVLERTLYIESPWILLFTLTTIDAIHAQPPFALLMLIGTAVALLSAFVGASPTSKPRTRGRATQERSSQTGLFHPDSQGLRGLSSRLPALYRLSVHILLDRYRTATAARTLISLTTTIASILLMHIWNFDSRALPLALLVQALTAMIAAGAYRDLQREHERALPYLAALPIPASALARADSLVVVASGLPFLLAMAIAIAMHRPVSIAGTGVCLSSAGLFVPLLAALRFPQVHLPRQSLVAAFVLTGVWTLIVWLLLL